MKSPDPQILQTLYREACALDVEAIKPGNVSIYEDGHKMSSEDFMISAALSAPSLCDPHLSLGERILGALRAVANNIPYNTNLGIVLLCAPLLHAVYARRESESLRQALSRVLAETTVDDAAKAYQAIAAAQAGGMGVCEEQDIRTTPTVDLRQAMYLARDRDRIARQYITDYQDLFTQALPVFLEFQAKWRHNSWAVTGVFLMLLTEYPDTLLTRKYGLHVAQRLQDDVKSLYGKFAKSHRPEEYQASLLTMDRSLKHQGLNPGTTADLVVATVLIANLEAYLRKS